MKAFRYEDIRYAGLEEGDRGHLRIELREYEVLKFTPAGFWIDLGLGEKRFVRNPAVKTFACLSKSLAVVSFKARKQKQRRIYQARLDDVNLALLLADDLPVQDTPQQSRSERVGCEGPRQSNAVTTTRRARTPEPEPGRSPEQTGHTPAAKRHTTVVAAAGVKNLRRRSYNGASPRHNQTEREASRG